MLSSAPRRLPFPWLSWSVPRFGSLSRRLVEAHMILERLRRRLSIVLHRKAVNERLDALTKRWR